MKCLAVLCGMSLWLSAAPTFAAAGAPAAPATAAPAAIRAGGMLDIRVAGEPTLTKSYAVDASGHISVDMVGQLTVAGRTPDQVAEELRTRLKEYVKDPVVTVAAVAPSQQVVIMTGDVMRQGPLQLRPGDGVLEALAAVGGLGPNADIARASLVRRGQPRPLPLSIEALMKGDLTQNTPLQDGDIVEIPHRQIPTFLVRGEVKAPGYKALDSNTHLLDAVSATGGLTPLADRTRITLTHKTQTAPIVVDLDRLLAGETSVNVPIQPDDVLMVSPKMVLQVQGEVLKTGDILLRNGGTLMEAISAAGGFRPDADHAAIQITHKDGATEPASLADVTGITGGPELHPGDVVVVGHGKPAEYITLFGAIRNPSPVKYVNGMKITEVLMTAGLSENSKWKEIRVLRGGDSPDRKILLFNLEAYLKAPKTQNLALQPGDQIFVEAQRHKQGILQKMLEVLPLANLFFLVH
jgi:polysaccharide export outer membrane protein